MTDLTTWGEGGELDRRTRNRQVAAVRAAVLKAERTAVELAQIKALSSLTMNLTVDLDQERQTLAYSNPEVAPLLGHIETEFVNIAGAKLRKHALGLGLF